MAASIPSLKSQEDIDLQGFTNYYNLLCERTPKKADLLEENISKGSMEYVYRIMSLEDDFDEELRDKRFNQLGKYFTWKGKKWATQKKK